ncbi:hypothetical protein [Krasilnikovia sp. MM14-A1259]|uniref:hypothetical protein n=1 Tax=Krasilnikovia sp. MM14-A1259 TaxID=3373539 RepID=UPI00380F6B9C
MPGTTPAQRCSRGDAVEVGSDRDPSVRYTVAFTPDVTTCTCPGFVYHGHCKHTGRGDALRCPWNSDTDEPQKRDGACPRCGAATITAAAPDSDSPRGLHITITISGAPTSATTTAQPNTFKHAHSGCAPQHQAAMPSTGLHALDLTAVPGACPGCTVAHAAAALQQTARALHSLT